MISVIIPTYNEENTIASTVKHIQRVGSVLVSEIVVTDGGSTDNTVNVCSALGVTVVRSPRKGRAAQMNYGSSVAKGEVLFFLHADSYPPTDFDQQISKAINDSYDFGCFQLKFDLNHWFLKSQAWFTRFDINAFRYGDQGLFVTRNLFTNTGGFKEDLIAFEDNEIVVRLKKVGRFKILPGRVTTSARKYIDNGVLKTQFVFYLLWFLYRLGASQQTLLAVYRKLIRQSKI